MGLQPLQCFPIDQVLRPEIGLGLEQAVNVQRPDNHAIDLERPYTILKTLIGLPIGSKQQVNQEFVGDANVFRRAIASWR